MLACRITQSSGEERSRGWIRDQRVGLAGKLYLKVLHLLAEDKLVQSSDPPLLKRRRPGPKHPNYGIPADLWPNVLQRVVEQKEPLRTVAAAYGVSHETIRRIIRHILKQHGQQEA